MLILMLFYVSKLCPCAVLRSVLAPESLMFYISALLFSFPCLSLSKNHELTEVFIKNKENDNFLSDGYCNVAERRFLEDGKRNDKYGMIHSRPVSYPA